MFGTTAIPQTVPQPPRDWQVPQQPGMAPLAQLLAEAKRTNELLLSIMEMVADLAERVEWLGRQVAELKERS